VFDPHNSIPKGSLKRELEFTTILTFSMEDVKVGVGLKISKPSLWIGYINIKGIDSLLMYHFRVF
jgi:hypothetical protein